MLISEIAAQVGLATSTLRYYESQGLINPERDHNGYRIYGPKILEQLDFIQEAKQLGLSLPEIMELSHTVEQDSCTRVRQAFHPQLIQRLDDIDRRLQKLQALRRRIVDAAQNINQCPDNEDHCRTECAFLAEAPGRPTICGS